MMDEEVDVERLRKITAFIDRRDAASLVSYFDANEGDHLTRTYINAGGWVHVAADEGWCEGVRVLVDLGCDPNDEDRDGRYPIAKAASSGHCDTVRTLLAVGGRIDQSDQVKDPLFCAIAGRSSDALDVLLNAGADPLVRHKGQNLALNAVGFAYFMGAGELTEKLARYAAGGNEAKFEDILAGAWSDANA